MAEELDQFDPVQLEKVERLFEILESLSAVRFLRERLAFYGGTCLNFAYFEGVPRLSVDLDFNYRARDGTPWQDDWLPIDEHFKEVFYDLGYEEEDLKIHPNGPLKRLILEYERKSGGLDKVEVEIGYLRRMPLLAEDTVIPVTNPLTGNHCKVTAPFPEELFANKFCTMLYRGDQVSPRDVFDVYTISKLDYDHDAFRTLAILDSLTRPEPKHPRLHTVDIEDTLNRVSIDDQLKDLLRNRKPPPELLSRVSAFSDEILDALTDGEVAVIDAFHDEGRMEFDELHASNQLHPEITRHPGLLFSLKQMGFHVDVGRT